MYSHECNKCTHREDTITDDLEIPACKLVFKVGDYLLGSSVKALRDSLPDNCPVTRKLTKLPEEN